MWGNLSQSLNVVSTPSPYQYNILWQCDNSKEGASETALNAKLFLWPFRYMEYKHLHIVTVKALSHTGSLFCAA